MSDTPITDGFCKHMGERYWDDHVIAAMQKLEREVAALKVAKVEDAIGALGDLLEHLPTLWGDEVVEGELTLRVDSSAITRALDALALFAAPAAPQRDESEVCLNEDGTLDEVNGKGSRAEQMSDKGWFIEIGDVAVWLSSKAEIKAHHERRGNAPQRDDHHPGPRCSCAECLGGFPENMR